MGGVLRAEAGDSGMEMGDAYMGGGPCLGAGAGAGAGTGVGDSGWYGGEVSENE